MSRSAATTRRAWGESELRRWTEAKRETFLATLAKSANVTAAAKAAGLAPRGAYCLRQRDADFARQWQLSLNMALDDLEAALLERARLALRNRGARASAQDTAKRDSAHMFALRVLSRHRPNGFALQAPELVAEATSDDGAALIDQIEQRLQAIRAARGDG